MEVTIKFVDFWPGFNENNNYFTRLLSSKYKVTVIPTKSKEVPQLLFFSAFGDKHLDYDCLKIYYTGENDVPDFNECDYAISFHDIDFGGRHFRLPLYVTYPEYEAMKSLTYDVYRDFYVRDFCSVVVSNIGTSDDTRARIINTVRGYKEIASGGRWNNNVGGAVPDKQSFVEKYRFNLAFENSKVPGYVTEKIVQAFAAHTIPIYWGSGDVSREFNKDAFIDVSDYDSSESLLRAIATIDSDRDRYMKMLTAPKFVGEKYIDWDARMFDFLENIITHLERRMQYEGYARNLHYMKLSRRLIGHELAKRIGFRLYNRKHK